MSIATIECSIRLDRPDGSSATFAGTAGDGPALVEMFRKWLDLATGPPTSYGPPAPSIGAPDRSAVAAYLDTVPPAPGSGAQLAAPPPSAGPRNRYQLARDLADAAVLGACLVTWRRRRDVIDLAIANGCRLGAAEAAVARLVTAGRILRTGNTYGMKLRRPGVADDVPTGPAGASPVEAPAAAPAPAAPPAAGPGQLADVPRPSPVLGKRAQIRAAVAQLMNDGAARNMRAILDVVRTTPIAASFDDVSAVLGDLVRERLLGVMTVGPERRYAKRREIDVIV